MTPQISNNSNPNISVAFFGTHNFAAKILEGLLERSPSFVIKYVITQPDKPAGRGRLETQPPVKDIALKYNIEVIQPNNLKNTKLNLSDIDINIVVQYGKIIPIEIIETPKHGTINIHTSLLPKYRGASPIQSVLIAGEKETGVTIMKMDEELDSGPIISQQSLNIEPNETYLDLESRLIKLSMKCLLDTLPGYLTGEITSTTQDESSATYCQRLTRVDGKINWSDTTEQIYNKYRGLHPWPGIWTSVKNKRLKLLTVLPAQENVEPGKMLFINDKIIIGTADASLEVLEIQMEGKKVMKSIEFINGYGFLNNTQLTD